MATPYAADVAKRPAMSRKRTSDKGLDPSSDAGSPSGSNDGKHKTRARINMACIHCRHRKIKCDGAQPSCSTCARLRRECEYEPVTEYENLMSRERKRRNKEKKAAQMVSLGIFAGQSPLSILHPAGFPVPTAPLSHYVSDFTQANLSPLFMSTLEGQSVASNFGPRPRRGISLTYPASVHEQRIDGFSPQQMGGSYHLASVSQPPTPNEVNRFFPPPATPSHNIPPRPADSEYGSGSVHVTNMTPSMPSHSLGTAIAQPSSIQAMQSPSQSRHEQPQPQTQAQSQSQLQPQPQQKQKHLNGLVNVIGLTPPSVMAPPPTGRSGRGSSSDTDYDIGLVNLADVPTVVPTSAHVRPVDLPAPHGHFDFASLPFPTQDAFLSEVPFAALRRRSSIHLPVGLGDAFRRPSIAEVATLTLAQKVACKRTEKINHDMKQVAQDLLTDTTGIMAWNAQVQSEGQTAPASWAGFESQDLGVSSDASGYIAPETPTVRSNSDGLLSLGPLSPMALLSTVSAPRTANSSAERTSTASLSSVSSSNGDSSVHAEVVALEGSYFPDNAGKVSREISPFSLSSAMSTPASSMVYRNGWSAFQGEGAPMLSPVSDLNQSFNSFGVFGMDNNSKQSMNQQNHFQQQHQYQHQHLQSPQQLQQQQRAHFAESSLSMAFGVDNAQQYQ